MGAPQTPGTPTPPLVSAVLGSQPQNFAELAIGAPPTAAQAPVTTPATAELPPQQQPAPLVHGGRAWINIGGDMFSVPPEQADAAIAQNPLSRFATPEE